MSIPKISQLSHLLPGISHIRVRVFALLIVVTQACILGANNARMNDECNRNEIKLKYSIQLPTAGRHRLEAGGSCASAHFRSILLDLFIKTSGWQRQRIAAEQIRAAHWQRSRSLSLSGRHKQRALKQIYLAAVESKFSWLRLAFDCCLHAQQLPPGVVCVSLCVCVCVYVCRASSRLISAAVSRCSHCRAGRLEALLTDLKSRVIRAIELWLKQQSHRNGQGQLGHYKVEYLLA